MKTKKSNELIIKASETIRRPNKAITKANETITKQMKNIFEKQQHWTDWSKELKKTLLLEVGKCDLAFDGSPACPLHPYKEINKFGLERREQIISKEFFKVDDHVPTGMIPPNKRTIAACIRLRVT